MNKWRKWQIGGGATLLLALGFSAVRNDPAFALAHQQALENGGPAPSPSLGQTGRDRIFDDYQGQDGGRQQLRQSPGGGQGASGDNGGFRQRGGMQRGGDDFEGGGGYGGGYGGGTVSPNAGGGSMSPYSVSPRTRSRHS